MSTRPKNLDPSQLARRIVEEAAGEQPKAEPAPIKNPTAVKRGALGGATGGIARKAKLTADECTAIATKVAKARWGQEPS